MRVSEARRVSKLGTSSVALFALLLGQQRASKSGTYPIASISAGFSLYFSKVPVH